MAVGRYHAFPDDPYYFEPACLHCDDAGCPVCSDAGPITLTDLDSIEAEIAEADARVAKPVPPLNPFKPRPATFLAHVSIGKLGAVLIVLILIATVFRSW